MGLHVDPIIMTLVIHSRNIWISLRAGAKPCSVRRYVARNFTTNIEQAKDQIYWFHASDVPKTWGAHRASKPTKPPRKFVMFSRSDSKRIENAYQKAIARVKNQDLEATEPLLVKEDGLFSVDIEKREMFPTYWNGPIYEIRRGLWFYEFSTPYPCEWELSDALDKAYAQVTEDNGISEVTMDAGDLFSQNNGEGKFSWSLKITRKNPDKAILTNSSDSVLDMFRPTTARIRRGGFKIESESESDDSDRASGSVENLLSSMFALKDSHSKLESQMSNDYTYDSESSDQGAVIREVDHLVLCVHGIGQRLSQRHESMSFVHDINLFRRLLKKAAGSENNRVQVLPVIWRHDVSFAMTKAQIDPSNTKVLPVSLQDITIDGIAPIRNIAGDVVLDVLLYSEPVYKEQILENVTLQVNTLVRDFLKKNQCKRQPKISIIGHSLGSVIAFDLLSTRESKGTVKTDKIPPSKKQLEFSTENFFCIGSPLGLYQLINGQSINNDNLTSNIRAFYNIFHPSDPVSYRIEPLVEPKAASLIPDTVPYTRGGLTSGIQELTLFGQKISKNAASFWNSVANNVKQQQQVMIKEEEEEEEEEDEALRKESSEGEQQKRKLKPAEIEKIKDKLRALNPSGRLDYSIQEGVLDISLLAAIASHMSYFENEDVASFVLKRLMLSKKLRT